MRVTFNSTFLQSAADLARTAEEMAERQRQVSSGKRLHVPSDDPASASGSVRERAEKSALDQYTKTADTATSRLMVVDSVLSSVLDRLTAARTSLLSARGTVVTPAQREAAAQTLTGIRDAIYNGFNATFHGTYVFAGSAGTTSPYQQAADGTVTANAIDDNPIAVDVGQEMTVQITYSAQQIAQGTAAEDLFATLERAIAAARAGDDAEMGAAETALVQAFERVTAAQSHTGTSLNALEVQQARIRELRLAADARIAGFENANMAEAITKMTQAETAYRAALGAIGTNGQVTLMDYLR